MDDNETRLYLHGLLETTFPDVEVYFTQSGNITITRPCIIYQIKALEPAFANNAAYTIGTRFQIMFLSDIPGYQNTRRMFDLSALGVVINSNDTYTSEDVVHNVFIVSVGTL